MDINDKIALLKLEDESSELKYQYINVFKNPSKLPINQMHLERTWKELKKKIPKDFDLFNASPDEIENACFEKKTEIRPALDKKWLPKVHFSNYQPYSFANDTEDYECYIEKNLLFLEVLEYLLNCNYHQFWCTILFEPLATVSLRSFLLSPILPFQTSYLDSEYLEIYKAIYTKFILVYRKLLLFKQNEVEYMPESFGLSKLIEQKLLNLPIVVTLALLYKDTHLEFVNKVSNIYFENPLQSDFLIKEVESTVDESFHILEMINGYLNGFEENHIMIPISIEKRPAVFSLSWVYSLVTYLLSTVATINVLFHFHKPAVEFALDKKYPYSVPYLYVSIYKELYQLLQGRDELVTQVDLYEKVVNEINLGRAEIVGLYHTFATYCLDKTLENIDDSTKQQTFVEDYLKLMTTALDDEYFICDYNSTNSVENLNEMFQSCCDIDSTRTEFLVTCINKLPRNKTLEEYLQLQDSGIETTFRNFAPAQRNHFAVVEPEAGPSGVQNHEKNAEDIEEKIQYIMDMFPHIGDGFALQCLESYNYSTEDVINAILENNLPPHLSEIPFDQIRIPPEPEPEQPILAYKGKKPEYDDALKLLNDKREIKEIKNLVLEGVQYEYDHLYDDEYDDRYDDDVAIRVPDNPITEELAVFNPNRKNQKESESDESSEEEEKDSGSRPNNKLNFCEDPAILRERREARYRNRPQASTTNKPKPDVVGKAKGQGQDKSVLINRQKKSVNKSSHGNHNRKGGAQWKRSRGMFPS
ncbi:activating signal cointegrator 1 complex subunit 2 [Sitophilus oryzae]|uniref:Activating signal cointegrator 1 complex subunit 2 n=1 Tax=Sitophilus oryzae TaxID=7048 RepID=A0A6J2YLT2_SITOR|nr:activating signal cointegrator 1 complex subunit 2 [Sitophilus oryzae]